jgi:plasmid replication initiation protein
MKKDLQTTQLTEQSLVVQHNALLNSRSKLSLSETRLILAVVSMIEKDDEDFHTYRVKAKDFVALYENKDNDNEYRALKEVATSILKKPLFIPQDDGGFLACNWFSSLRYRLKEGVLDCSFDPKLKPYLLQLKGQFTSYTLEQAIRMSSPHHVKIYQLVKQYEPIGERVIALDEIKEILGVAKDYDRFFDFKRFVLEPAREYINAMTDIKFDYKPIREMRKIVKLRFMVKSAQRQKAGKKSWKDDFKLFVKHMRESYVNAELTELQEAKTGKTRLISVDSSGKIYDMRDPYWKPTASRSRDFWKHIFDNQDKIALLKY